MCFICELGFCFGPNLWIFGRIDPVPSSYWVIPYWAMQESKFILSYLMGVGGRNGYLHEWVNYHSILEQRCLECSVSLESLFDRKYLPQFPAASSFSFLWLQCSLLMPGFGSEIFLFTAFRLSCDGSTFDKIAKRVFIPILFHLDQEGSYRLFNWCMKNLLEWICLLWRLFQLRLFISCSLQGTLSRC